MASKARISPLMLLPPLLFAALAGLFFVGMQRDNPEALPSPRIDKPAPALDLVALPGLPLLDNAQLRAPGVKLVNFWGTWCVGCRMEHPQLLRMQQELGLTIHGINYNDQPDRAVEYLRDDGNPFVSVGEDQSGRNTIDWGVYGAPETFVLDADGVVRFRFAGPITADILRHTIMPEVEAAKLPR